jgi:hypothetical protein
MQGPTDEASVPMKSYVIDSRILGVTMRRKNGTRTMPVPAEEENPVVPPLPPPPLPLPPPPPSEDVGPPAAKTPRLQAPTSFSNATDGVTTDPSDDTPTDPVSLAAALPSAAASRAPGRRWKGEEDGKLVEAVKKHGKDWVAVAAMVPGRSNSQCQQRWTSSLDPANGKKGKWKPEEDGKLVEAVKKHGNDWVAVAALVPGRTNNRCHQRWTDVLDPSNVKKGKWKPEEDGKLAEAVKKHGNDWVAVAALVPGRTNKHCCKRWTKSLDPSGGKKAGKWKPEEDGKLAEAVKKHGNNWVAAAALVSGRTNIQCHQRWGNHLDPSGGKNAGKWKPEEDAKLVEAVKKHGKHWVAVAALFPGRTHQLCRRRWANHLDPDRASSTADEEHNDRNDEALVVGYIGNDEALV